MIKVKLKQTALLVLTLLATTMATAQTVNMSKYITLTVQQGQQIRLDLQAAAAGTPVKIVSGSTNQTITVGTSGTGNQYYTAGAGTMTVYGDITEFDCSGNGAELTALDASHNTALTKLECSANRLTSLDVSQNTALTVLRCFGNNFTTQALNDIMCSLPARVAADYAEFYPLDYAYDAGAATFMATNSQIAIAKNWQVRYWQGSEGEIPATTGTYTCPTLNMSKYITLTVQQGQQIQLDLQAAAAGTPVKIVSGSNETVVTVGTGWTNFQNYTAGAGTMTVYGDITGFDCSDNEAKLTALDASQNTALTELYCYGNSFTTQAFNDLMCSLSARTAADNAKFFPLLNASDAKYADFMAANSQIATAKNWQVLYYEGGDIPATTGTYTCPANMSRYITLTVQQGQQIRLDLMAAAAGTPIKIVSGSTDTVVTVGASYVYGNYNADATTMTVYGNIIALDCSGNRAKLTALDLSQNTALTKLYCGDNRLTTLNVTPNAALTELSCSGNQLTALDVSQNTALIELHCFYNQLTSLDVSRNTTLKHLLCYGNNFTTRAFNDIMCSLPARTAADNAKFFPLYNASDANYAAFMAANSQIATAKNWQVRYGAGGDITGTTGTYVCGGGSGSVNMNKYITLTVKQGEQIRLDLKAAAAGTPVKVVSGSNETVVTVGTSWTGNQNYTAGAGTMTVYGDITGFDCSSNGAKLTALNVTQNTTLEYLYCESNQLTSLDVSQNTALTQLYCRDNQLTSLDVSQNTALKRLLCYGNSFTVQALNDLMCSLPARTTADNARFYPLYNASDAKYADFMAANSQIAKDKNWQVRYWEGSEAEIPATTGTYTCPVIGIAEVASVPLAVYPNPATDILTVETEATGAAITITDLTGRTVLTSTATVGKTTLNVSELSAGTYIVRVGNRVGKIVKR